MGWRAPLPQGELRNENGCKEQVLERIRYSKKSPGDHINRECLADDTRASIRVPAVIHATLHPAALSAMVGAARSAVTHQHTGSGGSLKDIINTLDAKSAALFVVPGADVVSDTLGLRSCHVIQVVWVILRWPEVRFASDKDDRNDGPANRPHLFDPL